MDPTSGALSVIAQDNISGVHAFSLAMHPSGKFLYAADWRSSIFGFNIDQSSGGLTPNSGCCPAQPTNAAQFVAMTPSGQFLYLGTYDAGSANGRIVVFQVDSNSGFLVHVGEQATPQFRWGAISGDGQFLVSSGNATGIAVFQIDANSGLLTPATTSASGSGPLATSGRFVYAASNAAVDGFKINDDGSLTAVAGSPFSTHRQTCDPGTSSGSPFLFAPEMQDDVSSGPQPVHVFRMDSKTGTLTEVSGSPFPPDPQVPQMGCVAATVSAQ